MSAPDKTDPLAPARAKLDAKIAAAARTLIAGIDEESAVRGGTGGAKQARILVVQTELDQLRAAIAAFEAFDSTLGDGS